MFKFMNNPIIETDLAEILTALNNKIDKYQDEIRNDQKKILEEINILKAKEIASLKIGQTELKGEIKALDTKVEQLEKRLGNVEFASRGILIGLVLTILGGIAGFFWMASRF